MRLRCLEKKDAEGILSWMKDPEVNCFFRFDPDKVTRETVNSFIIDSIKDSENKHLAIANDKDEYLGTISLKHIDTINRNAEYAIVLKKSASGRGVGKWATEALFKIAFEELKLNKVYLNVLSDNSSAQKLYEKVGFNYEGELKEHLIINGEKKNLKLYGILERDWNGNWEWEKGKNA